MEISRDALMRVVKATRVSLRLAKDIDKLLIDHVGSTWANFIAEQLADALYEFGGEVLENSQDFMKDSRTIALLTDPVLSDDEVTVGFMGMYRMNHPEQPKPCFINRDEMRRKANAGHGYMMPDGDWK